MVPCKRKCVTGDRFLFYYVDQFYRSGYEAMNASQIWLAPLKTMHCFHWHSIQLSSWSAWGTPCIQVSYRLCVTWSSSPTLLINPKLLSISKHLIPWHRMYNCYCLLTLYSHITSTLISKLKTIYCWPRIHRI